jgi:outer membrane protein assembly factor BamA
VRLKAKVKQTSSFGYVFDAEVKGSNLSGTGNPVQVSLGIGDEAGVTSIKAHFGRI